MPHAASSARQVASGELVGLITVQEGGGAGFALDAWHMVLQFVLDYHPRDRTTSARGDALPVEDRTARLTILIDPRKKAVFERLCAEEDVTPSQMLRRLIRRYIEERTGSPWSPGTADDERRRGARGRTTRR